MKSSTPEATAYWDDIRAAIPTDRFNFPPSAPLVSVEITDDKAVDIDAFVRRRAAAIEERARK